MKQPIVQPTNRTTRDCAVKVAVPIFRLHCYSHLRENTLWPPKAGSRNIWLHLFQRLNWDFLGQQILWLQNMTANYLRQKEGQRWFGLFQNPKICYYVAAQAVHFISLLAKYTGPIQHINGRHGKNDKHRKGQRSLAERRFIHALIHQADIVPRYINSRELCLELR
jgi:hypothetical protein